VQNVQPIYRTDAENTAAFLLFSAACSRIGCGNIFRLFRVRTSDRRWQCARAGGNGPTEETTFPAILFSRACRERAFTVLAKLRLLSRPGRRRR
jgi:hypothetical protein